MRQASTFFIQTFGCRCNQADSGVIRESLCRGSLREAKTAADADLVVLNTCTITRRTDQQVRQAVRKVHRENPGARVLVTGCYAERDPQTLAALPGVSLVVGNADKERLAQLVAADLDGAAGRIIRGPLDGGRDCLLPQRTDIGGRTRPFVKLQDGCDARCSYCIVPAVRGAGKSARPEDILAEIRNLIERGYQEIVLTGVHLGTYGRKLENPVGLVDLLRLVLELPGLGRLRLSSIEPMRFSREIVDLAAASPAFAPHFHVPLQSGSDRILRRMRRPYTARRFTDLLEYMRKMLPEAGLGTDVLVGFPGESDEDFKATCDVLLQSPLTYAHVFPFSAREGTPAGAMPDQVPPGLILERARTARSIAQEKNLAFRRSFLGRVLNGITLAREEELGESTVLTENYIHVRAAVDAQAANRMVRVRLDEILGSSTRGTLMPD